MERSKVPKYVSLYEMRAMVLREAVSLFLEQGYAKTTIAQIAGRLNRTKSAVLRVYKDKEAILFALVTHMFGSQFSRARELLGADADPLLVYGVETALQLHICELSESLRDIYVNAYTLPSTAEYIYQQTSAELCKIFAPYMPEASESDFYELEIASASVMRGYMTRLCDMYFPIAKKIRVFLTCELKIYDVPADKREAVIKQVLQMDIETMAKNIIAQTVRVAEAGFDAATLEAVDQKRK